MPQPQDIQVSKLLTNVSLKYSNDTFIADKLFPAVPVSEETGIYYVYDKSNLRPTGDKRAGRARANEVQYNVSQRTYGPIEEHAEEIVITDREMKIAERNGNILGKKSTRTETLTEMMLLNKEKELADMLSDTAVITQNVTLAGNAQFNNPTTSDPFGVVQTAVAAVKKGAIKKPNTIAMGYDVYSALLSHPAILERVKYSARGVVTQELLAEVFQVKNVYIGEAIYNTAKEGQADNLDYVWGKHLWLAYVEQNPELETITAGYTLELMQPTVDERFDNDNVTTIIRRRHSYEPKLMAAEGIYLVKNAVA